MKVYEFITNIENDMIKIPENQARELFGHKVKVRIEEEENASIDYDLELENIYQKYPGIHVFEDIKDAVEWQRQIRSDWDR